MASAPVRAWHQQKVRAKTNAHDLLGHRAVRLRPTRLLTTDNLTMNLTLRTLTGIAAALLAACTPTLNWRSVSLPEADLTITLPCKPDDARRTVEIAGKPTELSMVGCEADGALFAVSHTAITDAAQVGPALTQWRSAVIALLGDGAETASVNKPFALRGALVLPQSVRTVVQGRRPDGTPVVAQAVWFARASGPQVTLYHAVIYTDKVRPELADPFFSGLKLQ